MKEKFLFFDNPKNAIYFLLILLMAIGCVNVYSASFVYARSELANSFHFVIRYLIFGFGSIGCLLIVRKVGYRFLLTQNMLAVFGIVVVAGLICVLFFGPEINSARRWLDFGFAHLQPSEFAKVFIIMLCSAEFGKHIRNGKASNIFHSPTWQCLLAALGLSILVYIQPDMGTAAIIFGLAIMMSIVAGMRSIQMVLAGFIGMCCSGYFIYRAAYRSNRILMWLNPWQDPTGMGYQMVQSLIAIGSGGLIGMEWGAGVSKLFFLPELHTDFAFAIFCQENGFLGAIFLISIFFLLGLAMWTIARRSNEPEGFLLVSGVVFLIVGQAVANMAIVCGVLPIIGVPLSFISYGGSSMLTSCIGLGLVLSVYDRECDVERQMKILAKLNPDELSAQEWRILKGGKQ